MRWHQYCIVGWIRCQRDRLTPDWIMLANKKMILIRYLIKFLQNDIIALILILIQHSDNDISQWINIVFIYMFSRRIKNLCTDSSNRFKLRFLDSTLSSSKTLRPIFRIAYLFLHNPPTPKLVERLYMQSRIWKLNWTSLRTLLTSDFVHKVGFQSKLRVDCVRYLYIDVIGSC